MGPNINNLDPGEEGGKIREEFVMLLTEYSMKLRVSVQYSGKSGIIDSVHDGLLIDLIVGHFSIEDVVPV